MGTFPTLCRPGHTPCRLKHGAFRHGISIGLKHRPSQIAYGLARAIRLPDSLPPRSGLTRV